MTRFPGSACASRSLLALAVVIVTAGCAEPQALAPGESYILSQVGYTERLMLKGLVFQDVETGDEILIEPGRAVLTRAPAGRYRLDRVRSAYDNMHAGDPGPHSGVFSIQPGRINYIGRWHVVLVGETRTRVGYAIEHDYAPDVIEEAREQEATLFVGYPVAVAHPVEVEASGTQPRAPQP